MTVHARIEFEHSLCLPCCLQIENEYGFCGSSKAYLRHLAATARRHLGNNTILYTTDPPAIAPKGSIYGEEVYTCVLHAMLHDHIRLYQHAAPSAGGLRACDVKTR